MGKPTGFMEYERTPMPSRPAEVRLNDFYEIYVPADEHLLRQQGARCMDCGIPFCQSTSGCPIDNLIPEWNDLVYHGQWEEAYHRLARTNNFPEFTGRICPAPCEDSCVLGINEPAVTIKSIECSIIDRAFANSWVIPHPPEHRTGKNVAVIGSGPAGLAAADQLNTAGHLVTVFERDDRIGGLLMYGVPNMKLDKGIVKRRVDLLKAEGIIFKTNTNVGGDPSHHGSAGKAEVIAPEQLMEDFDAVVLACGALKGRDLPLPGRELKGVHMAMEYLWKNTQSLLDSNLNDEQYISAKDKQVIVIGAGDTGTDCIGTALRHGCKSLINITRREREPDHRDDEHPWPGPPGTYFIDYGHAEGIARYNRDPRQYGIKPQAFIVHPDDPTRLGAVRVVELEWSKDPETGKYVSVEKPGSEHDLPCDLCFVAAGFTGTDAPKVVEQLGVLSERGTVSAEYGQYQTNVEKVFAAGDMRRGASLIVWAIAEGRGVARAVDEFLMGHSDLPAPDMDSHLLSSAG